MQEYKTKLEMWAREEAELAKETTDEREKSIHLMKASMYGPMLTQLGRVVLEGIREDALKKVAEGIEKRAEELAKAGDPDMEDREKQKLTAVRRAMALLEGK